MAAADPVKYIKDQATCSICLDLFLDPVITECGHSFCRECIAQYRKGVDADIPCPQCKKMFLKKNLRPNRELKNIVESITQLFGLQREEEPGGLSKCEKHQELLKFFCKNDQTPICVICRKSRAHWAHTVVPMQEAVPPYRVDTESHRQRCEDLASETQPPDFELKSSSPARKETELQGHEERENIRKRVVEKEETASDVILIYEESPTPKYGLDHTSLDPAAHTIGNRVEDTEHKVDVKCGRERFEDLTYLKAAVESAGRWKNSTSPGRNVAAQTELRGREEEVGEVLEEQKVTEARAGEEAETPRPVVRRKYQGLKYSSTEVRGTLKKVDVTFLRSRFENPMSPNASVESGGRRKDNVSPGGNVASQTELWGCEVDVMLDPATAQPQLILSKDRKSVRCGDTWQDLPNNPERFDVSVSVLGSEGFTSERHYWEVEVGETGDWAIGVARHSVRRKGGIPLKPEEGIWVLTPSRILQFLHKTPRKLGVYLNYASSEVTFYNAENMTLISSVTAEFTEKVFPFFHLWSTESYIKLCPCQR